MLRLLSFTLDRLASGNENMREKKKAVSFFEIHKNKFQQLRNSVQAIDKSKQTAGVLSSALSIGDKFFISVICCWDKCEMVIEME